MEFKLITLLIVISIPIISCVSSKTLFANSQTLVRSAETRIPNENTEIYKGKKDSIYFTPDEFEQSYFKLNLTGFDIGIDEKVWKKYEPVLTVRVRVGTDEYVRIIGSGNLKIEGDRVRTIVNEPIVGPFPYTGGDAKITINLYKVAVEDKLNKSLDAVQKVVDVFGVGNVVEYTKISGALKSLLDTWFASDSYNVVSFQRTWQSARPNESQPSSVFKAGYVVIHQDESAFDWKKVTVDENDKIFFNNQPISKQKLDYVILQLDHSISRRDYQERPFFKKYEDARIAAKQGQDKVMDEAFNTATAILSIDRNFTEWDRKVLTTRLYDSLLPEIRQHVPTYKEKVMPLTKVYEVETTEEAKIISEMRQEGVETGLFSAGQVAQSRDWNMLLSKKAFGIQKSGKFLNDISTWNDISTLNKIQAFIGHKDVQF